MTIGRTYDIGVPVGGGVVGVSVAGSVPVGVGELKRGVAVLGYPEYGVTVISTQGTSPPLRSIEKSG